MPCLGEGVAAPRANAADNPLENASTLRRSQESRSERRAAELCRRVDQDQRFDPFGMAESREHRDRAACGVADQDRPASAQRIEEMDCQVRLRLGAVGASPLPIPRHRPRGQPRRGPVVGDDRTHGSQRRNDLPPRECARSETVEEEEHGLPPPRAGVVDLDAVDDDEPALRARELSDRAGALQRRERDEEWPHKKGQENNSGCAHAHDRSRAHGENIPSAASPGKPRAGEGARAWESFAG